MLARGGGAVPVISLRLPLETQPVIYNRDSIALQAALSTLDARQDSPPML